jgi:hypothetical protein
MMVLGRAELEGYEKQLQELVLMEGTQVELGNCRVAKKRR